MQWLAFALALTANADQPCADPRAVSLTVHNYTASYALRELALQSKRNIAMDQEVRGRVTIDVHCVPLKIALQQIAAQLRATRSEEHTSELQSRLHLLCRLLLEKKNRAALAALLARLSEIGGRPVCTPGTV